MIITRNFHEPPDPIQCWSLCTWHTARLTAHRAHQFSVSWGKIDYFEYIFNKTLNGVRGIAHSLQMYTSVYSCFDFLKWYNTCPDAAYLKLNFHQFPRQNQQNSDICFRNSEILKFQVKNFKSKIQVNISSQHFKSKFSSQSFQVKLFQLSSQFLKLFLNQIKSNQHEPNRSVPGFDSQRHIMSSTVNGWTERIL